MLSEAITSDLSARFWSKVNKDGPTMPGMDTPCWVWTGATSAGGYPNLWIDGRQRSAVRGLLRDQGVTLTRQMCVLHRCDNPPCVRHLWLGTQAENIKDMHEKGRGSGGKGDGAGVNTHPERRPYGDRNGRRTKPECTARGERASGAKLTDDAVVLVLRAVATGQSFASIGRKYGVHAQTIGQIAKGNTWVHIPR